MKCVTCHKLTLGFIILFESFANRRFCERRLTKVIIHACCVNVMVIFLNEKAFEQYIPSESLSSSALGREKNGTISSHN